MTERDKMLAGSLYDATDAALTAERAAARDRVRAYNSLPAGAEAERRDALRGLFGHVGARVEVVRAVQGG